MDDIFFTLLSLMFEGHPLVEISKHHLVFLQVIAHIGMLAKPLP